ncbi:MAG: patatin-like phospholipase family protein [Planctomycetota bacterium]|nr:patatin-like phospholipase family protein [Planctomycetota bacterium]
MIAKANEHGAGETFARSPTGFDDVEFAGQEGLDATRSTVGLAFSGGGPRGFAHLGFLDGLAQAGIAPQEHFDCVCGTSCGSLVLLALCHGWSMKDAIALVRRELPTWYLPSYFPTARLWQLRRFLGGMERKARRHFPVARLETLRPRVLMVSYDLVTCRTYVARQGDPVKAMIASMSLPGLMRPTVIKGRVLVDGGVAANLPAQQLREVGGVRYIIGVDVSGALSPPISGRRLKTADILLRIWEAQQKSAERRQRSLCDVLVKPQVSDVAFTDFSRKTFDRVVDAGRQAADAALPAIRRLLRNPESLATLVIRPRAGDERLVPEEY